MNENNSKKETKASWFGAHMSGAELDFPSQLQIHSRCSIFHSPLAAERNPAPSALFTAKNAHKCWRQNHTTPLKISNK